MGFHTSTRSDRCIFTYTHCFNSIYPGNDVVGNILVQLKLNEGIIEKYNILFRWKKKI